MISSDGSAPDLSVIVPVGRGESGVSELVSHVRLRVPDAELVLVQSGGELEPSVSQDLEGQGVILATAEEQGRGAALDAGVVASRGEALLFLHCDTRLPEKAGMRVAAHLEDPEVVGGWFFRWLDGPGFWLRLADLGANSFSLLSGIATGDQALFCRRRCWEQIGSLRDFPLFEDMTLVTRLRRLGRVPRAPGFVLASPRRFRRLGVVATVARNLSLSWRFFRGADPRQLFREYYQGA
jgi:glycosyltransferase involved in cell wall biosynthesis